MKDLLLWARVVVRTSNIKISRRRLADYVKTLHQNACRTCSTIIFLHSTNEIIDLWRCRWRCRRQILNSLLSSWGSRDGVVVIALASHLSGPGSGHGWVMLVVSSLLCSERFFSGFSGFPLLKNQHFQISIRSDAGPPWKPLSGERSFLGKYQ